MELTPNSVEPRTELGRRAYARREGGGDTHPERSGQDTPLVAGPQLRDAQREFHRALAGASHERASPDAVAAAGRACERLRGELAPWEAHQRLALAALARHTAQGEQIELAGRPRDPRAYAAEQRARDAEDAQRRAELEMRAVGSPQDREHALKEGRGRYDTGERALLPEGRIRNARLEVQLGRSRGDRGAADRAADWLRKMERLHEAGRLPPRTWMTDGARPDGREAIGKTRGTP